MQALALTAMATFILTWLVIRRRRVLSPIDLFVAFVLIQFGPHVLLNHGDLVLSRLAGPHTAHRYFIGIAVGFLALSVGLFAGSLLYPKRHQLDFVQSASHASASRYRTYSLYLCIFSLLYIAVFLLVDDSGLPRLTENIRFFLGISSYDYTEIRRVLFAGSLYEELAARTRFTLTPILICLLVATAIRAGTRVWYWLPIVVALYVACALQLSKFPSIYYIVLVGFVIALVRHNNYLPIMNPRTAAVTIIMIVGSVAALYGLYNLQYAVALDQRILVNSDIIDLMIYRPFFAVSDALYLWFDFFPERRSFAGIESIDLLAGIFGYDVLDPTIVVPAAYLGGVLTTMQTGVLGSGYAAAGFAGIGLYAFVAGMVAWIMAEFPFRLPNGVLRTVAIAVLGLNTYFLTTRQLHTALASGGTLSTVAVLSALFLLLQMRRGNSAFLEPLSHGRRQSMH